MEMETNLPGVVVGPRLTLDNVNARLAEVEQVVSTIAKTLFTDDSMTQAVLPDGAYVTNTTNVVDRTLEIKDNLIRGLEQANEALRAQIKVKDREIERLTDLVRLQDKRVDEYHDAVIDIRVALDSLSDDW